MLKFCVTDGQILFKKKENLHICINISLLPILQILLISVTPKKTLNHIYSWDMKHKQNKNSSYKNKTLKNQIFQNKKIKSMNSEYLSCELRGSRVKNKGW